MRTSGRASIVRLGPFQRLFEGDEYDHNGKFLYRLTSRKVMKFDEPG